MEHVEVIQAVSQPRDRSHDLKVLWGIVLGATGMGGVACGITGLLLSFLAAAGVVDAGSGVRLAVPIVIVISLTLFMGFAHAMDRLQQLERNNSPQQPRSL